MTRIKLNIPYLRSIVRNDGKGRLGLGVELFRLDAVEEDELTIEEQQAADEAEQPKSSTAVMRIYEEIGEDFWTGGGVTAKKFSAELDELGDIKRLNIHINSLGGDAATAQALYNIIGDHSAYKTTYIDGVAASAATIVACGADEVIARLNTNYMVHYPWVLAIGNADVMRKAAEDLEKITIPIVSVYKEQVKGKIDEAKIRQLMQDETWMTADEAFEYGFVDRVRGKIKAIAKVSKTQISCSGRIMDIAKYHYRNVPNYPFRDMSREDWRGVVNEHFRKPKLKEREKEEKPMTAEELAREHPDVLASIRAEAAMAERTRLAALDAMSVPGLESIIAEAKAKGKQPQDIAMDCFNVTKTNFLQVNQVNALKQDARGANAVVAGDAPLVKPVDGEDKKVKGVKLLTAAQANLSSHKRFAQANGSRN